MAGSRPTEAGETLLELVISVTILGLGVLALLGGLTTAVLTTSVHRKQVDVSAVLTEASEQVKSAPYRKCAVQADYLGSFAYPGWTSAPSFTIADWNGTAFVPRNMAAAPPRPCDQFEDLGHRVQLITLTVVSADGAVDQTMPVVKRFRDCPTPASPTPGCD